jgi:dolichol-phosphate mannosyltransferase
MHGLIGYYNFLLNVSTFTGFAIAGFSFLLGLAYLIMKLRGFPFPLSNPTIVILILFLGGIQLISVGILGQYVGRTYEEVKRRPKFILDRAIGFDNN